MPRPSHTPAPGVRFITATVNYRPSIVDRIIAGPAHLGPSEDGPSFDENMSVGEHELAVCYLDSGIDWAHNRSHWAVGTPSELAVWLMDEAAISERRRGLIAAIGLRELWKACRFAKEILVPLEHSVVTAIDNQKGG